MREKSVMHSEKNEIDPWIMMHRFIVHVQNLSVRPFRPSVWQRILCVIHYCIIKYCFLTNRQKALEEERGEKQRTRSPWHILIVLLKTLVKALDVCYCSELFWAEDLSDSRVIVYGESDSRVSVWGEECSLSSCGLRSSRIPAVQPKVRGSTVSELQLHSLLSFVTERGTDVESHHTAVCVSVQMSSASSDLATLQALLLLHLLWNICMYVCMYVCRLPNIPENKTRFLS